MGVLIDGFKLYQIIKHNDIKMEAIFPGGHILLVTLPPVKWGEVQLVTVQLVFLWPFLMVIKLFYNCHCFLYKPALPTSRYRHIISYKSGDKLGGRCEDWDGSNHENAIHSVGYIDTCLSINNIPTYLYHWLTRLTSRNHIHYLPQTTQHQGWE